jgi:hypothetical protein
MKKLITILAIAIIAPLISSAQTTYYFTNSITFTQRWTSVVATITSKPTDTNGTWTVSFQVAQQTNPPAWRGSTNNITMQYSASHSASVTISNADIAAYAGLTTTGFLAQSFYVINGIVMSNATKRLNDEYGRR